MVVKNQNFTYFWCSFLMTFTKLYFLVNSVSTIIYIRLDWDRQTANFASCQKEINSNLPDNNNNSKRVHKKCTLLRIKQHLEKTYGRKFAYGTVVRMCVARNRRRRSAQNYTTVAQVTTRRARKGFELIQPGFSLVCHIVSRP